MDADLLTSLPPRLHRDKFPGLGETASSAEAAHAECHKAVALGCEGLAPCCGRMYRNGVWHAERHFIYIILTYDSIQICKYHLFLVTLLMQSNKRSVSPHNVNTPAFVITATLPFPLQQKPTLPFQKGHPQPPTGGSTFCPKGCEPFAQRGSGPLPKRVQSLVIFTHTEYQSILYSQSNSNRASYAEEAINSCKYHAKEKKQRKGWLNIFKMQLVPVPHAECHHKAVGPTLPIAHCSSDNIKT